MSASIGRRKCHTHPYRHNTYDCHTCGEAFTVALRCCHGLHLITASGRLYPASVRRRVSVCCGEQWSRGRAPDCQSRGRWFNPTCRHFDTSAISYTSHYLCLSEETLKAGGPFYLVYMPGEVKAPTLGVNV